MGLSVPSLTRHNPHQRKDILDVSLLKKIGRLVGSHFQIEDLCSEKKLSSTVGPQKTDVEPRKAYHHCALQKSLVRARLGYAHKGQGPFMPVNLSNVCLKTKPGASY